MKNLFYILITTLSLTSCTNWLDVQPYDRVAEDIVFNSVKGFENALNGIYIELNSSSLYGLYLSSEMIEVMGQRYNVSKSNTWYNDLATYKYSEINCKTRFSAVWSKAYSLIANTNLLLKNCEVRKDILSKEYYKLIKGEALALRGLLHFDIFRLFGPLYDTDNQTTLPYYKKFSFNEYGHYPPQEFMNNVIADLREAADLLKDDLVRIQGSWSIHANTFTSYRKLRLNWYAVQLLLARAELYRKQKTEALIAARNVIDAQEKWFPWIKREAVSSGRNDPDRIFFTEVVFGLQNPNLVKHYASYFDGNNLSAEALLAGLHEQLELIFDKNKDDYRYEAYFRTRKILNSTDYNLFEKYKPTLDSLSSNILPMLRVSEAFYIAAECEPNPADGLEWLNRVLTHRGAKAVTNELLLEQNLEKEYIREFYGEGQLFFYYKRLKYKEIKVAYDPHYQQTVEVINAYRIPIPEEETKYN